MPNNCTCSHRVVNVDDIVLPLPGPLVVGGPIEVVVLIRGGDHWTMQLQGTKHGGPARAALEPDNHRGGLWALSSGEEPEKHVAIVGGIHSQEARVALNILVETCKKCITST